MTDSSEILDDMDKIIEYLSPRILVKEVKHEDGKTEVIELKTELAFAIQLHPEACEGFSEYESPPDPITWLQNGKELKSNWEMSKVAMIGEIEHKDTSEQKKKILCDILETYTCLYMDLMSSIYVNFSEDLDEDEKEKIDLEKDEDEKSEKDK